MLISASTFALFALSFNYSALLLLPLLPTLRCRLLLVTIKAKVVPADAYNIGVVNKVAGAHHHTTYLLATGRLVSTSH